MIAKGGMYTACLAKRKVLALILSTGEKKKSRKN